jgi:DNA polymerase III subunit delta'
MTNLIGHDAVWRQFASALDSGKLHHGWILAGPRGLGKASFALRAAASLVDPDDRYSNLIARGTHPDILTVKRLPKEVAKDDDEPDANAELKRSITIEQIRNLQASLTTRPGLADIWNGVGRTRSSNPWKSRQRTLISFWSAMRVTGCCRQSVRGAKCCVSNH